jgi:alkylation response protein AidB-like acyl-CoA dehydrogenase
MPYKHKNFEVRRKFCECYLPEPRDEVYAIVEELHDLVDDVIMPIRRELDGGWHHDPAIAEPAVDTACQALVDFGLLQAVLPEELGGPGGVLKSMVTYGMMMEEIGRADAGIANDVGVVGWFFSPALNAGRLDLVEHFGKEKLLDGKMHRACVAVTEPAGGVNIDDATQRGRAIRTSARLEGGEWVINGAKIWPSSASVSDIGYLIVATTDPAKGEAGVALIYVPADAEGLSFGKPLDTMGMCHTDVNTEVFLDEVRVPVEFRVTHGTDLRDIDLFKALATEDRSTTPGTVTGVMQGVLEILLEFTHDRLIAGKPMRERSLYVHALGGIVTAMEASRAAYLQTCYMVDHPETYGRSWESFLYSKAAAADQAAMQAIRGSMQVAMDLMGSYSTAHEYHVEKYFRDLQQAALWLGGRYRVQMDTMLDYYAYDWATADPAATSTPS